ncbi:PepSY-associated TM helix domain-containing protein [Tardiphaga sp. 172_B4_N1_3]|jgi:sulfite reductase (NADPH) flavoprotein alpha-component|uniref:PepSY-associated TM helix domain-containing protein n=1 Tax=Tardiphaga sp. 172_B4_N1_3 TaxID=3240787 RepID=UPI003F8A980B
MASRTKSAFQQVHSIIGLAISLILGLIGLTGAMLSFEDEIVAALNRDVAKVDPRPAPVLSPDALVALVQAIPGSGKVAIVTMSSDPGAAVRIRARGEGGERASVYVDPYDGHVLSAMRGEGFFVTLRNLHRFLLLPGNGNGVGRQITGISVLGLFVLLISGLVLRWPRRVRSIKSGIKTWLKPNLAMPGRPFHWSLHSVTGTWVLPIYLVSILTGLWWSFDWYKDSAISLLSNKPAVTASAPRPAKEGPKGGKKAPESAADAPAAPSFDKVWSTFLADQGSRYAIVNMQMPNGAGSVMRVRSVAKDAPFEEARDEFRIDGVTGRIVSAERYNDKSTGDRILAAVLHIHTGAFLGLPGRILFMLAAALMPLFTVTGFILYFSRRRLRAASKPGRRHAVGLVPGE